MSLRFLKTLFLAATAVISLAGCGAMVAQNPSGKFSPVNAVAEGNDSRVLLKGADVVAYFIDGRYEQGVAQFSSLYEGVGFRFASAEHKTLFDRAPAKYLPQFGGYCANGIAYGIPWGGDADTWKMIDGKLYIFGGQGSKDASNWTKRPTWRWRSATGRTKWPATTASCNGPNGWCSACRTIGAARIWRAPWRKPERPAPAVPRGEYAAPAPDRTRRPGRDPG